MGSRNWAIDIDAAAGVLDDRNHKAFASGVFRRVTHTEVRHENAAEPPLGHTGGNVAW